MRVLLEDGMQINVGTGIGKYSLYMYNALKNLHLNEFSIEICEFDKKNVSQKIRRLQYMVYINSIKYRKMTKRYDVIHFTNYAIPFLRNKETKYVVTIHDLASFLYPDFVTKMYGKYNRFITRYAIKQADCILTVSESVKKEICQMWPQYSEKVEVAYPGLYSEYGMSEKLEEEQYQNLNLENKLVKQKFFLFVGTIEKRKNIGMILDAFITLKKEICVKDYKIVLAGRPGFGFEEFQSKAITSGCSEDIIFSGYTSTEDCKLLYREAAAYIFPTVYEGFGSTQLECMANKLPIILSDIPTNREISGDYGFFFDLSDINSLVNQMRRIVMKEYQTSLLEKEANFILNKFKWEELALRYYEVYKQC